MMGEHSIADDLLRNGYERWLLLEAAKAEVSDDIKELMAELKGHGFTPKAVRESFRRVRDMGDADQQEHDAIVDLYVASLTRAHPAPAHEKTLNNFGSYAEEKGRGVGKADTLRGELTDNQEQREVMDLAAAGSATDEASTSSAPASHSNSSEPLPRSDKAGEARPSSPVVSPAAISDNEPFEPSNLTFLRKSAADYRPHCQRPDACGASGLRHCYICQRSIDVAEMAEHARASV